MNYGDKLKLSETKSLISPVENIIMKVFQVYRILHKCCFMV